MFPDKELSDLNGTLEFQGPIDYEIKNKKSTRASGHSYSEMVNGIEFIVIRILLQLRTFQIGLKSYRNPLIAIIGLKKLIDFRRSIHGNVKLNRVVKSDGRYFFALNVPGWPSKAFDQFMENSLNRVYSFRPENKHLQTMIFAITKKCPLRCEHCFEWNTLNDKEVLTLDDLHMITERFQDRGIGQIQFSGGEPLQRIDDLISVLKVAKKETDFWILTSGYGLNIEKAHLLKEAGLTGVDVSLDHWDPDAHNAFRGLPNSYQWVEQASANVRKVDLVLGLTLCATKSFVTEENLWRYADLTRQLGAGFVQILEPRAVGHYAGKAVDLSSDQQALIEKFYLEINRNKKYIDYPTFMYPAYHQREIECFGAGDRYVYVDADGDSHACPFCQEKLGNCITESIDKNIEKMREKGCHKFKSVDNEY
tara:strand:- start:125 stop:1390 length:1266 start_codon:yes stop_codon:yes gene_type:complete